MDALVSLALLVIPLFLLQGCFSQELNFETGITYEKTQDKAGNWSANGHIRLTEADLIMFEPILKIQTCSEKCTLDLQHCPTDYKPKSENFCFCQKISKDRYTIHVGAKASPSQSGLTIQAVVPSKKVFQPIGAFGIIGKIPQVSENTNPTQSIALMDVCLKEKSGTSTHLVTQSCGQQVLCDTVTDGQKWTIIQRRIFGNVDFFRGWQEYVEGFGDLSGDFWFGLEHIHSLCNKVVCEARFEMKYKGESYYAKYNTFVVLGSEDKYRLIISGYTGNAGDMMKSHNGMQFSTKDNDNDSHADADVNCAEYHRGGWWYWHCHHVNLNGIWNETEYGDGLNWKDVTGYDNSVTYSEIKVRPRV